MASQTVKFKSENALTTLEVRELLTVLGTHAIGTPLEDSARRKLRAALRDAEGRADAKVRIVSLDRPVLKLVRPD